MGREAAAHAERQGELALPRTLPRALPLLAERIRQWSGSPLSGPATRDPSFARVAPELEAELSRWFVRADEAERARLPVALAEQLVAWLHRRNQFLDIADELRHEIERLYRDAMDRVRALGPSDGSALSPMLERHQRALAGVVREVAGESPIDVVCAEYSPATQLRVLGLELSDVRGPALDLGSGEHGRLVSYLHREGVDAIGIDRHSRVDHVVQADWLNLSFEQGSWGTVISHLGFSLHLLHHHYAGDAESHVRAYLRILHSLAPGGAFHYAPSLPFIEDLLGAEWRVHRRTREVDGVRVSASRVVRIGG